MRSALRQHVMREARDDAHFVQTLGSTGDGATTPDAAALDITGDLELRLDVAVSDWDSAAAQILMAKWTAAGSERSWRLFLGSDGVLVLNLSPDGSSGNAVQSGAYNPFADGVPDGGRVQLRLEMDVDDGAGNRSLVTRTRVGRLASELDTDVDWVLKDTDTDVGTTSINVTGATAVQEIGTGEDGTQSPAKFYRVIIKDGIAGTVVLDAQFDRAPIGAATFTESSSNSATMTIGGNALIGG